MMTKGGSDLKALIRGVLSFPCPSSLSFKWSYGSLLGMSLAIQILTGVALACYYTPSSDVSFSNLVMSTRDVHLLWAVRMVHMNGASLFFVFIYLHLGRNLYYLCVWNKGVWITGFLLLVMLSGTAFLGYVLPWGQMSYWGAAVITSLLSAVPYIGGDLVSWLWGGYSLGGPTISRFFSLHYLLPFLMLGLVMGHIFFLHQTGSSNPLGVWVARYDSLPFHPYYSLKDLLGVLFVLGLLMYLALINPGLFGDPVNYNPAHPLSTPEHIQPEWYFLFAYAILRSIPSKLGGVLALLGAIVVLLAPPFLADHNSLSAKFNPIKKSLFWSFVVVVILLSWIGANPVEYPFIVSGQVLSVLYFGLFGLFISFG